MHICVYLSIYTLSCAWNIRFIQSCKCKHVFGMLGSAKATYTPAPKQKRMVFKVLCFPGFFCYRSFWLVHVSVFCGNFKKSHGNIINLAVALILLPREKSRLGLHQPVPNASAMVFFSVKTRGNLTLTWRRLLFGLWSLSRWRNNKHVWAHVGCLEVQWNIVQYEYDDHSMLQNYLWTKCNNHQMQVIILYIHIIAKIENTNIYLHTMPICVSYISGKKSRIFL